jgi:23S rRNA (cytosine1962-C5)-methyltransferase
MGKVIVTDKGRRWIDGGHPWIYADDVAAGGGEPGGLVQVCDPEERALGWGLLSTRSKIAVRLISRAAERPERSFWLERARSALLRRERAGLLDPRGACRLVAGDADGFPGLVVDRYADTWVVQCGTQGADRLRDLALEVLTECASSAPRAVLDRSDASVRRLEGLGERVEWLRGADAGPVRVEEPGLVYEVDVQEGHKTGHYLDQRDNRRAAAAWAAGRAVLDAFCYDGLFGIRAALAGAERVVCLDESARALERARRNAELNGVEARITLARADAMRELRLRERGGERYGLVVVDPPAFARNKAELPGAARGYRELNRRALGLVESGGALVSASCSYHVQPWLFLGFLRDAAAQAGRRVYLEELRGAAADHPVLLSLPETWYLKCAFLRAE